MKTFVKTIVRRIVDALRVLFSGGTDVIPRESCFTYDYRRFKSYSGVSDPMGKETLRAKIVMRYHVLEKGLTMPNRRLGFGRKIASELIQLVYDFKRLYLDSDCQVLHAIAVLRAYWDVHVKYAEAIQGEEKAFWNDIKSFSDENQNVPPAFQLHMHRAEFYKWKDSPFREFAWARHTLRHYSRQPLPDTRLTQAIELARSAPSACNRQYCRVHCVSDKSIMERLLAIQGGNRGFGCYADKVLVLTADLRCSVYDTERNDVFINGGMYLMNLCYALYHYEIAHCVLNWSCGPKEDEEARKILDIPQAETIIALLTCGEAPSEFDVAESPRTPF